MYLLLDTSATSQQDAESLKFFPLYKPDQASWNATCSRPLSPFDSCACMLPFDQKRTTAYPLEAALPWYHLAASSSMKLWIAARTCGTIFFSATFFNMPTLLIILSMPFVLQYRTRSRSAIQYNANNVIQKLRKRQLL